MPALHQDLHFHLDLTRGNSGFTAAIGLNAESRLPDWETDTGFQGQYADKGQSGSHSQGRQIQF